MSGEDTKQEKRSKKTPRATTEQPVIECIFCGAPNRYDGNDKREIVRCAQCANMMDPAHPEMQIQPCSFCLKAERCALLSFPANATTVQCQTCRFITELPFRPLGADQKLPLSLSGLVDSLRKAAEFTVAPSPKRTMSRERKSATKKSPSSTTTPRRTRVPPPSNPS